METSLVLASNNSHKYHELSSILPSITLLRPIDFSITLEVKEKTNSFQENAGLKAETLFHLLHKKNIMLPVLADDSGITLEALDGAPGLLSARYGADQGIDSDKDRTALLLKELGDHQNRSARYICAAVLLWGKEQFALCQEIWQGRISRSVREGLQTGFGYDPVFIPEGDSRTVSEMSEEEKNRLSHRAKAVHAVMQIWGQSPSFFASGKRTV